VYGLLTNAVLLYDWINGVPGKGGLAESWEWSTPTEMVFRLKKGVRFQELSLGKGREMDSGDAVASLDRARRTEAGFGFGNSYRYVKKYEAADKHTVKVQLSSPDANYLYYLANLTGGVVLPREALAKSPDNLATPESMYGTGPFVWDQNAYRPDVSGAADRNPK
jgi:peptide/nickel transport system substrate-binding protein